MIFVGKNNIKKKKKVHYFNCLRYGTARVGIRLKTIRENTIYFNQCFGGGTEHAHGEDSLFLTDCLKKKLKIFAVPIPIATLKNERESTWFNGYNEKYFRDQGKLCKAISPKYWKFLCLYFAIRFRKKGNMSVLKMYKLMSR